MTGSKGLIAALAAGLILGLAIRLSQNAALIALAGALQPLGTLWLNALKMTLVPLIFAMVANGIGSFGADRSGGRTLGFIFVLFAVLIVAGTVIGMATTALMLAVWPVTPGALGGLIAGATPTAQPAAPGIVDQLVSLVPINPVAAAAEGQMAPLVIFALFFGIAMTRIPSPRRESVAGLIEGIAETMMAMVQGILWFAPVGVFILSLGVALAAGLAAVALLSQSVVICCIAAVAGIAFCYPLAWLGGGIGLRRFAAAAIGPQAMAAGTCSSMATLPAMIEAAETRLDMSPALAGAALPLAASTFRFGTALLSGTVTVFVAAAAGLHPTAVQYCTVIAIILISNAGIAGLPGAAVLYAALAPSLQVIGGPLGFIPLWVAVIAIPDIFITTSTVTADLAVATVIARFRARAPEAIPA